MPAIRGSGVVATAEEAALAELSARATAFGLDPYAAMLAAIGPDAPARLAERDPAMAAHLEEARQRAESLALQAFELPHDDAALLALHLLEWCHPETVARLAERAESARQRWMLAEYLLARYPAALDAPDRSPLAELPDWKVEVLLEIMRAVLDGATRPGEDDGVEPAQPAARGQGQSVSLYYTVIVHGTAARSATWWRERPGTRNFWAYIRQFCPGLYGTGHEFSWSGGITHSDREQAAREFIDWWHTEGAPAQLQVIAHSHGCNVVYTACAMEPALSVANMVALGSPVRIEYPPVVATAGRIQRIHNVYSEYDSIQVAGSLGGQRGEGRTLGDGAQITNHHVPWEDPSTQLVQVWHSDLHEESVWQGNGLPVKTLL